MLQTATFGLDAPFAVIDLDAFDANTTDLMRRASGVPLRLASKSLRVRTLQARALKAGFQGQLCFTLPEALWLASLGWDDLVVGYPTVDRGALRQLASDADARAGITVMVDCVEHLDLIAAAEPGGPVKVCIDIDAGWRVPGGLMTLGPKRSPLHDPFQAEAFARTIVAREELRLDGIMAYEGQIAGVGDRPPGRPLMRLALPVLQALSARELARRRAEVVDAVRSVAPLRFVNGGGTGSIERTAAEPAVTEVAAGSGLYGPTLFDTYRAFRPTPAAFFVLPVVRKTTPKLATALGGGYIASGAPGRDRLPRPVLPAGLKLDALEAAGEVQTPLLGRAAAGLRVGDQVWFRHAKAGELCERFDEVHLVQGDKIVDTVPTYRGEGKTFL
ncbi:D-serine deaminase-like pyridoxal phosphate-dependent protein [Solirubrobacter pauli]|uniref:D-serine deaminase-like pyridoxal phosphate-dependent protein n=1 Tax=Solirubrobacter pauli TaxID=166793 RepID=A0A660LB34_9ACTN|nr:D-serine deaminase-like pyridoxal phosphate-dependent protein [Solirubrobacter pauli]